METHSIKQKRHRRTKKEMQEFREKQKHMTGDSMLRPKKSSQKSNLEEIEPVLEVPILKISCISKPKVILDKVEPKEHTLIQGWINIYKDIHGSYWCGGDIHYTIEAAKKAASAFDTRQIQITFEEL